MSSVAPPTRVIFDMETRDPDDVLTLCLLATHPAIALVAVTVTPGTPQQLGVVRTLLRRLDRALPIGAREPASPADAVSPFHHQWLGAVADAAADELAHVLLARTLRAHPDAVLLTGAPLHNLRLLLRNHPDVEIPRWVAQGGFAGDNLVDPAHRLAKFAGRTRCESFNFGGDKKGTLLALASPRIAQRDLVSKNVTHGVAWDGALHDRLARAPLSPGAALAHEAMTVYLRDRPEGKLLHDPLAACAILDRDAFTWAEIEVLYDQGQWGAQPATGTHTAITIAANRARIEAALFGLSPPDR